MAAALIADANCLLVGIFWVVVRAAVSAAEVSDVFFAQTSLCKAVKKRALNGDDG